VGIVEKFIAAGKAREVGLDLVEVSPMSDPPVCRIMDYGKWLYEQKRKTKESRKKSHQTAATLKEIRLRPETDKHDLEVKLKHGREFLEKGHRVQFTLIFRGRQLMHQEKGQEVLNYIVEAMQDVAKVDRPGKLTNKRIILLLAPK
jgi:translation initiation factor IF-3